VKRVDLVERDARDEPAMERELLPDGRQRFLFEEIPRVFIRSAGRLPVRTFRHHPLRAEHHGLLRARQLGCGESVSSHALKLGHQRIETAPDAVC
jgi:hypothetical protein